MKANFLMALILCCICSHGQKAKNKLQFHSISFSPISFYGGDHTGGLSLYFDLGFNSNKNIIKASILSGSEFDILGDRNDEFTEIGTLFGREILKKNSFRISGFAGLAYFKFKSLDKSTNSQNIYLKEETISLPLQTNFRFQTGESFSLGLQLHCSINSANTIFNTSILLQWLL